MKRLTLILAAWLIPALAGAQGIPIYPQPLFRTSTPIFKGLGPLTGPVILDTTAGNTYARQMSPPALTSATPDNGSGSLTAGVYTITVVGVDLAGGVSLYPTAITCTVTGGTSHCDIVYVASVGAVSVRVYASAVNGATPIQYFTSTSATTYALTTLVGATVAALPTSNSAYRLSIGGETSNWLGLPLAFPDGTAVAPSLTFASDTDTGWFWVSPNAFAAVAGTNQQLQIENGAVRLGGSTLFTWGTDLIFSRESAAVLQMGFDAAGVTNQMFKGPDRITSDGVGGNLTIAGGRNRGASAGGSLIFQTSPAAGAGVTGTLGNVLELSPTALTITTIVAPASSGTRFLCIDTAGVVTSSASACSGT